MFKYIFQRVILISFLISFTLAIGGIWIPNFYTIPAKSVKILKNELVENTYANSGGVYKKQHVTFEYVDQNDIRHTDEETYDYDSYNNQISSGDYKEYHNLIKYHKYNYYREWLIILMSVSPIILFILTLFTCGGEMNLNRDYYNSDIPDIANFRLNMFYLWNSFCGYNQEDLNEFCNKEKAIECRYGGHMKTYSELKDNFLKYIKEKKETKEDDLKIKNDN